MSWPRWESLGSGRTWPGPVPSSEAPTGGPLISQQMPYSASLRLGRLLAAKVGRWQDTGDCLPGSRAGNWLSDSHCLGGSSQVPAASEDTPDRAGLGGWCLGRWPLEVPGQEWGAGQGRDLPDQVHGGGCAWVHRIKTDRPPSPTSPARAECLGLPSSAGNFSVAEGPFVGRGEAGYSSRKYHKVLDLLPTLHLPFSSRC